jgi:hypothetical protein
MEIMEERGFENPAQLSEDLGMNVIRWFPSEKKVKTKVKSVELDSILFIAEKYNKSLDWLVYGKKSIVSLAEMPTEIYESQQPAPGDLVLISRVTAAVHEYLSRLRLKIGPNRFGQVIAMGYEQCITDQIPPDNINIKQLLKLTRLIKD